MKTNTHPLHRRAKNDWHAIRRHEAFGRLLDGDRDDLALEAGLFCAQSLGRCRLYGLALGDSDGSLPLTILTPVCESLADRITAAADTLPQV